MVRGSGSAGRANWAAAALVVMASMAFGTGQAAAAGKHHEKGKPPTSWSLVKGFARVKGATLSGVSCPDATDCEVVGTKSLKDTFAERLSGTKWSVTPSPNVGKESQLLAVSCVDASDCMAVGDSYPGTSEGDPPSEEFDALAEWWNGSTWTVSPTVNVDSAIDPQAQLDSVSCTAGEDDGPINCVAVGWTYRYGILIETWDGSTWTVAVGPTGATEIDGLLASVSCPQQGQCMAVGEGDNKNVALQLNDGTWTPTSTPQPGGLDQTTENYMYSVSCPQTDTCIADDWWGESTLQQEELDWNSTAWSAGNSFTSSTGARVTKLTCLNATSCVAVGYVSGLQDGIATQQGLVELGSSGQWSVTPSPTSTQLSSLVDVSCGSVSFCVAVGTSGKALVESGPA